MRRAGVIAADLTTTDVPTIELAKPRTGKRRWAPLALVFVAVLSFTPPATAQQTLTPQAYRLSPGDRISVVVFGQAELSGDMLVDVSGYIRLPFLEPIEVGNLTLAECQKRIVDRLADGILRRPAVHVQITELRPVFVLGDVRTTGAQAFKFGMTVKSAIATAGGFGTVPTVPNTAITDVLASDERVRQLTLQKAILGIRKARIEAQRDGAATFPSQDQLDELGSDDLADIVAIEKETFESQKAIQQSQIDLLQAQKPRIQSEIEALGAQIATRRKQLELVRQHADQYTRLSKQGLGLAATEMQLRLTETTYESEVWNLSAQVARLRMDLGALDIRIQEADAAFKRQLLNDLREVRDRLKDIEVTLPTAREMRDARLQQAGSVVDSGAPRTVMVTRGQNASFQADDTTPLEPGDIIEIQIRLPRGPVLRPAASPQLGAAQAPSPRRDLAAPAAAER